MGITQPWRAAPCARRVVLGTPRWMLERCFPCVQCLLDFNAFTIALICETAAHASRPEVQPVGSLVRAQPIRQRGRRKHRLGTQRRRHLAPPLVGCVGGLHRRHGQEERDAARQGQLLQTDRQEVPPRHPPEQVDAVEDEDGDRGHEAHPFHGREARPFHGPDPRPAKYTPCRGRV
eukprot:768787-Hanusia_phi.AAC.4